MKTVNDSRQPYEAPRIEVIEIEVEKGFAASASVNDWGNGGHLGDYDVE